MSQMPQPAAPGWSSLWISTDRVCCSTGLSGESCSPHYGVDGLPLPAGINAAQWNYQRDAAANNAWENRKELLMDWSSSVVSVTVGSFLCMFLFIAHTLWPKAWSYTLWQNAAQMHRSIPDRQVCLATANMAVRRPAGMPHPSMLAPTAICAQPGHRLDALQWTAVRRCLCKHGCY